jgi:hypothetical protein
MVHWSSPNQGIFRRALTDVYPDVRSLRRFIKDHFDHNLRDIPELSVEDWAEDLMDKADREDWLDDLYQAFCNRHIGHSRITQLKQELGDQGEDQPENILDSKLLGQLSSVQTVANPLAGNTVTRSPQVPDLITGDDPRVVHLVIAAFHHSTKQQSSIRLWPTLCYWDPESEAIAQKPFDEIESDAIDEQGVCTIDDVPDVLEALFYQAAEDLDQQFPDPMDAWTLVIHLLLPIELMSRSLTQWCRPGSEVWLHPIVIGCSDRLSPDARDARTRRRSASLRNQLAKGWQRLQECVPNDDPNITLANLKWLESQQAKTQALAEYAGFKCYDDWLQASDLERWGELIQSGIPIALWMCEQRLCEPEIKAFFDDLTNHSRISFLKEIPIAREKQRKTCKDCVGVFYEDPNYTPNLQPLQMRIQQSKTLEGTGS